MEWNGEKEYENVFKTSMGNLITMFSSILSLLTKWRRDKRSVNFAQKFKKGFRARCSTEKKAETSLLFRTLCKKKERGKTRADTHLDKM